MNCCTDHIFVYIYIYIIYQRISADQIRNLYLYMLRSCRWVSKFVALMTSNVDKVFWIQQISMCCRHDTAERCAEFTRRHVAYLVFYEITSQHRLKCISYSIAKIHWLTGQPSSFALIKQSAELQTVDDLFIVLGRCVATSTEPLGHCLSHT